MVKDKVKKPAYMVVVFPSQHTLEQAFKEAKNFANNEPLVLPAKFIRADTSRLAYELPMDFKGISLIMEKLLDWRSYKLKANYRTRVKLLTIFPKAKVKIKATGSSPNRKFLSSQSIGNRKMNIADNPKYKSQNSCKYELTNLQKALPANEMIRINELKNY